MGYRSTFVTDDNSLIIPPWFKEKYDSAVHYGRESDLPLSSSAEYKCYGFWESLMPDLQQCISEWECNWKSEYSLFIIFLHEDGKHDKYEITIEEIKHIQ